MTLSVDVEDPRWPDVARVAERCHKAVMGNDTRSVALLFASDAEVRVLNKQWRGQDKPTNVLSFPASPMPGPPGEEQHLGDIILAFETVKAEAVAQAKPFENHVSHLIVHGLLHLLGLDHDNDADADAMESRERDILAKLGIPDPYLT
jgi:probable rRNA maturation factor